MTESGRPRSDTDLIQRDPHALALTSKDQIRIVGQRDAEVQVDGDGDLFSEIWAQLADPISLGAARAMFSSINAEPLLDALMDAEILDVPVDYFHSTMVYEHLLLVVTGSSFAHEAPRLCGKLRGSLCKNVDVILTEASTRFCNPYMMRFFANTCFENHYQMRDGIKTPHAALSERADLILVWPATANTLAKFALGESSDLASTAVLASTAPVVVSPAMNPKMWRSKPVQRNVRRLRDDGFYVLEPSLVSTVYDEGDVAPVGAGAPAGVMELLEILKRYANDFLPRKPQWEARE